MDAQAWLEDYQRRISEIGRRARDVQERLTTVDSTVTSRDGEVTVTVTPGGGLRRLVIHEAAERLSRVQLAETITTSIARAHAEAATAAADVVAALLGERSAAMQFVRAQVPSEAGDGRR